MSRRAPIAIVAVAVALSCRGGHEPNAPVATAGEPAAANATDAGAAVPVRDAWTSILSEPKYAPVRALVDDDAADRNLAGFGGQPGLDQRFVHVARLHASHQNA